MWELAFGNDFTHYAAWIKSNASSAVTWMAIKAQKKDDDETEYSLWLTSRIADYVASAETLILTATPEMEDVAERLEAAKKSVIEQLTTMGITVANGVWRKLA